MGVLVVLQVTRVYIMIRIPEAVRVSAGLVGVGRELGPIVI